MPRVSAAAVLLVSVALASGCARHEMYDAPLASDLQVRPGSINVGKSGYFLYEDAIGMAFLVDAVVTSTDPADDGMPLGNIRVEVYAPSYGVYTLPGSAITTHNFEMPDNWNMEETCFDEEGNLNTEDDPLCGWLTDQTTGNAFEISETFAQPEDFAPNYLQIATDSDTGIARFWIFVDALPYDLSGEDFSSASQGGASVYITTGVSDTNLTIETTN
jgi:hypothetical protein